MTEVHHWREVVAVAGPQMGRGSLLQGGKPTVRRARRWLLTLSCGHQVRRPVRYSPHADGYERQRGGTQFRSKDDVLPAPKRARCEDCGAS